MAEAAFTFDPKARFTILGLREYAMGDGETFATGHELVAHLRRVYATALRDAVAAEREACAAIADQCANDEGPHSIGVWVAQQIRARGGVR
jgi:hypothetical protein